MIINDDLNIRLFSDVFYRQYGDECYVWKTSKQQMFSYDHTLIDVLNNIGFKFINIKSLIDKVKEVYNIESDDIENIYELICDLINNEIIESYNQNENETDDLELEDFTAERHILYGVLFELTYSCNEKCKHCYVDYKGNDSPLNTSQIYSVIDQLVEANVNNIVFSGGDIFTRNDAFDIIRYAVSKRMLVDIYTNGLALDDAMIFKLAKLNLRSVQCSIYGSNALIHDNITAIKGSFNKTIDVLVKFKLCGTPVSMKVPLMKDNIKDFENIKKLAMELGIPPQFSTSIRPTMQGNNDNLNLRAEIDDIYNFIKLQYKNKIKEFKEKTVDVNKELICRAGFNSLTINPFGDVYICESLGDSIGNLKETSLLDIWNNSSILKEWRKHRQKDLEECAACNLLTFCHFCPAQAYLETGQWNKKYDEACTYAQCYFNAVNGKC
ncbi:radical SAM protein [Selenomonas ruminantium]|uniref:radical SAM/SPASM domain-containing protein n=1 Tax=Selenomonas ruminantium TaxID=971 RepID=UPI0026EB72D3|nr:radical SAM protein [Selenomonas ruminantium]